MFPSLIYLAKFGRCSYGCHVILLQTVCALRKIGREALSTLKPLSPTSLTMLNLVAECQMIYEHTQGLQTYWTSIALDWKIAGP